MAPGSSLATLVGLSGVLCSFGSATFAGSSTDCKSGGKVDGLPLSSVEGQQLLLGASHAAAYWPLSLHFTTELPGRCGPASAAMVLNALKVPAPASATYSFPLFNHTVYYWEQDDVHDGDCVQKATTPYLGSLDQVAAFVSCRGVDVQVTHANVSTVAAFRESLKVALSGSSLVAVNFARSLVDQIPNIGHHSPVGAYDEQSDRVLVMDVARYKYPPVWHCADRLFEAMAVSLQTPIETPRGWLVATPQATTAGALRGGAVADDQRILL